MGKVRVTKAKISNHCKGSASISLEASLSHCRGFWSTAASVTCDIGWRSARGGVPANPNIDEATFTVIYLTNSLYLIGLINSMAAQKINEAHEHIAKAEKWWVTSKKWCLIPARETVYFTIDVSLLAVKATVDFFSSEVMRHKWTVCSYTQLTIGWFNRQ